MFPPGHVKMQDFLEGLGNQGYPRHKPRVLTTFSSGTERLRVHSWLFTNESADRGEKPSGHPQDPSKDPATLSLLPPGRFMVLPSLLPHPQTQSCMRTQHAAGAPHGEEQPSQEQYGSKEAGHCWLEPSLLPCRTTKIPSALPALRHGGQRKP